MSLKAGNVSTLVAGRITNYASVLTRNQGRLSLVLSGLSLKSSVPLSPRICIDQVARVYFAIWSMRRMNLDVDFILGLKGLEAVTFAFTLMSVRNNKDLPLMGE